MAHAVVHLGQRIIQIDHLCHQHVCPLRQRGHLVAGAGVARIPDRAIRQVEAEGQRAIGLLLKAAGDKTIIVEFDHIDVRGRIDGNLARNAKARARAGPHGRDQARDDFLHPRRAIDRDRAGRARLQTQAQHGVEAAQMVEMDMADPDAAQIGIIGPSVGHGGHRAIAGVDQMGLALTHQQIGRFIAPRSRHRPAHRAQRDPCKGRLGRL
ncbi:hypothetical protein E4T56_gene12733, partial [Termitomyces sp. T112]